MEYLCHKWPRICPTCRKNFPLLYPFTIHYRVCYLINTTYVTSGAGNAYPCGAPEFTSGFSGVRVTWSLVWYLCFVDRCLSFSTFSVVFFFDIRIQIAPLVSSNSSLITSFNMAIHDVTWLVYVKTFWTRITPVFFFCRHYHRISQQLHIYRMNSVSMFTTLKVHGKHYMHCVTHCVRVKPHQKMLYPMIAWLYASEMRICRCCKRCSYTLLNSANTHTGWQFLSVHDMFW
jgi:hypothetical protein